MYSPQREQLRCLASCKNPAANEVSRRPAFNVYHFWYPPSIAVVVRNNMDAVPCIHDDWSDSVADLPHTHEHAHGDVEHTHAHVEHDHEHVEHQHEHAHDDDTHAHPHVHEKDVQDVHEHAH
jgi:hypothetical protein